MRRARRSGGAPWLRSRSGSRALSHVFHRDTPSEVRALDAVDLELERGTFTVVLGTNGSGKSSLLNAIAGSLALTERPGVPGRRRGHALVGAAPRPPDQPGVPEPVHRHRVGPERGGEPGARRRPRRRRGGCAERWARAPAGRPGAGGPARHGTGGPARHADRCAVRRAAPGADACSWPPWCGRRCCCWTSTPRRSIRGARSRSSA